MRSICERIDHLGPVPHTELAVVASTQFSQAAAQNIDRHGKPWWSQPEGGRRFTNPADRCPGETLYHLHPRPVHSCKSAVQVHVGLPCRYSCGCSRPISDAVRAPADDGEQGRSSIAGAGVRSSDRVGHATYGPVRFQLRPSGHQHAPAPRVPVLYADVRIVTRTPSNSCSSRLRGDRCSCADLPGCLGGPGCHIDTALRSTYPLLGRKIDSTRSVVASQRVAERRCGHHPGMSVRCRSSTLSLLSPQGGDAHECAVHQP
jgi:hypothetical protein